MASVIRDLLEKLWGWISAGVEKMCSIGSTMIWNLVEKVCSWISVGVETIVDYVQEVVKTIVRYVPTKVSLGLSRLRNLWTMLKSSISSARDSIKEKCLKGIRVTMKCVLQRTKFVTAEIVELFKNLKNVPKRVSNYVMRSLVERVARGFGVAVVDAEKLISSVLDLIRLCKKHINTARTMQDDFGFASIFQDLAKLFAHVMTIIGFIFKGAKKE